jgi:hypothetical protein
MKSINETFTDEEFARLATLKGPEKWHDYIIRIANVAEEKVKKRGA